MAQVDHLRVAAVPVLTGLIELAQQGSHTVGAATYQQGIAARVSHHLGAVGALLSGQQAGQQLRGIGGAGMAQGHDLQGFVTDLVKLAQQAVDAFEVAAPIGDHQQVGRRIRGDHTDTGVDQRLENTEHLLAGGVTHIEYAGGHTITAFAVLAGGFHRHRLQARGLVGDDLHTAIGQIDRGIALGTQLG
ncbi:hypothetical protein D3C81_1468850 [compost metagenome]